MTDISGLPRHIAIIPDGNRRWARSQGLTAFEGHRQGFAAATRIIEEAWKLGVPCMTLWGFSTENWDRKKEEVSHLMDIFTLGIDKHLDSAKEHQARIIHLGRKDRLPKKLQEKILYAEKQTAQFTEHYLSIALDYGGKDELVRAVQKMVTDARTPQEITPQLIDSYMDTKDLPFPQPDLIIRTGGEERLSGFMLWQAAYSELLFVEKFLPAFTVADFMNCLEEYKNRERRFGK